MHTREESHSAAVALTIETGKWAKQADGSVIVRMGDTMVMVTACHSGSPREGIDFLPLTVDYREYAYSSGRIPGGFFKREGKPTEKEMLTSRVIDRPIRPLFPSGWRNETQVIAFVLSADTEFDSDVLAITGASAALALSEMPFEKTIAGVRVGLMDGAYIVNPTFEQRQSEPPRPGGRGQPGWHRDGRSGRQGSDRRGSDHGPRRGPQGHQTALRRHRRTREEGGTRQGRRAPSGPSATSSIARSKSGSSCRSARRCASRASSRTTSASTRCSTS